MLARLIARTKAELQRPSRSRALEEVRAAGLPTSLYAPLKYLVDGKLDKDATAVRDRAEARRQEIAARGDETVPIYYSPQPGSAGADASADARPQHGTQMAFTMKQVANTGKKPRWGTFLYLCARETRARTILELGSCAGISGSYLASSPFCDRLLTIEGSESLANIARESISRVTKKATVYSKLFDDALDEILLDANLSIDLAFIDGHHESVATIHYYERIKHRLSPGSLVIFDDISWSSDMRDGWNTLVNKSDFSCTIDLGVIGLCIYGDKRSEGMNVDLRDLLGESTSSGTPWGWQR